MLLVLFVGILFAASDEYHQCFSQGRTPGVTDVLIDTCGVAVGALYLLFRKKSKKMGHTGKNDFSENEKKRFPYCAAVPPGYDTS